MLQPHHDLRLAAIAVRAEQMRAALDERASTRGAYGRLFDFAFAVADFVHAPHNFGDDLVRTANPNARADFHALAQNILPVIQRGAAHRRARQLHRRDVRQRGQLSGSADLPGNVLQRGGHFFGFKFIRHRPAREFIGIAQRFAHGEIGDLDHRAVDHVIQIGA